MSLIFTGSTAFPLGELCNTEPVNHLSFPLQLHLSSLPAHPPGLHQVSIFSLLTTSIMSCHVMPFNLSTTLRLLPHPYPHHPPPYTSFLLPALHMKQQTREEMEASDVCQVISREDEFLCSARSALGLGRAGDKANVLYYHSSFYDPLFLHLQCLKTAQNFHYEPACISFR